MEKINCPNIKCKGHLKCIANESTTIGYFTYDQNVCTETYKCNICLSKFERSWRWHKEELNDD